MILAFNERLHKLSFYNTQLHLHSSNKEYGTMVLCWRGLTETRQNAVLGCIQESYTLSLQTGTTPNTALRFLKFSLLGDEEQHYSPFQSVQHLLEITAPLRSIELSDIIEQIYNGTEHSYIAFPRRTKPPWHQLCKRPININLIIAVVALETAGIGIKLNSLSVKV